MRHLPRCRPLVTLTLALLCAAASLRTPSASSEPVDTAHTGLAAQLPANASPQDRTRFALDKNCARCHQQGRTEGTPAGGVSAILDLDGLARDRYLIAPGRPDASPLYNILLSRHAPQAVFAPGAKDEPTAAEIDAVRTWIAGLDARPRTCPGRGRITLAATSDVLQNLKRPEDAIAARDLRLISLAVPYNNCATEAELEGLKSSVAALLNSIRTTAGNVEFTVASEGTPILALTLGELGWNASQWDALAVEAGAPRLNDPALIDTYGTATPIMGAAALASAASRSGRFPKLVSPEPGLAELVRSGLAGVDLPGAAADLGLTPSSMARLLERYSGVHGTIARRLSEGRISRAAWQALAADLPLPGRPGVLALSPPSSTAAQEFSGTRLDVGLWTDKAAYRRGELVTLTAQANRDCNLTVINVDTRGDATVLFPSDSDPDNAVKAGSEVRIPSATEPFQLRANDHGTETFIAVCTLNRKRMEGVGQDFETQRFSILGNWATFLATASTREAFIARKPPTRRRGRARTDDKPPPPAAPTGPEQEARAAIYVKVE